MSITATDVNLYYPDHQMIIMAINSTRCAVYITTDLTLFDFFKATRISPKQRTNNLLSFVQFFYGQTSSYRSPRFCEFFVIGGATFSYMIQENLLSLIWK
jgi:hypothetical protein